MGILSYYIYFRLNYTSTIHQQIITMKVFRRLDLTKSSSNMSMSSPKSYQKVHWLNIFSSFVRTSRKRRDSRISHFQWLLAPNNVSTVLLSSGATDPPKIAKGLQIPIAQRMIIKEIHPKCLPFIQIWYFDHMSLRPLPQDVWILRQKIGGCWATCSWRRHDHDLAGAFLGEGFHARI